MKKLIFATHNNNKLKEVRNILNTYSIVGLNEIGFSREIDEKKNTFDGNALLKARHIYNLYKKPVIADDSGLVIKVLNGEPGVHSARFAGLKKDNQKNIEKVLKLMENKKERNAFFTCVLAFILNNKEYLFEGRVNGTISEKKKGHNGFGYDPIFIPESYKKTFGQLDNEIKLRISHRTIAINKLKRFLNSKQNVNI